MGHLNNNPHLGFSSQLLATISECRGKVEQWVEKEKQAANEMERKYKGSLAQEQTKIDGLEEDLLALQFKLGININNRGEEGIAHRQKTVLQEKEQLQAQIASLKTERDTKNDVVKRLEKEEVAEQARAAAVRAKKRLAEESKNTTVEDLTKGIINYKYMGFDFSKAANQRLRFSFSQLDPEEPSKKFSFVLGADDFNFYFIEDCSPPVEPTRLLAKLNADDDLGQFVLGMRCEFLKLHVQ